jgi:hypothetical protein
MFLPTTHLILIVKKLPLISPPRELSLAHLKKSLKRQVSLTQRLAISGTPGLQIQHHVHHPLVLNILTHVEPHLLAQDRGPETIHANGGMEHGRQIVIFFVEEALVLLRWLRGQLFQTQTAHLAL